MSEQPDGTGGITCPLCGALIPDPATHSTWHASHGESLP